MRIFIGGVMQASITGKGIVSQDYRRQIAEALRARWPEIEIIDPFEQHPTSVEYDDARARETLFASLTYAAASDLLIAYVPTASMGTALEMYAAHQRGIPCSRSRRWRRIGWCGRCRGASILIWTAFWQRWPRPRRWGR